MFWSRPSISEDLRDWILECFDWFDGTFEPPKGPILPTKAFFGAPGGTDEATAKLVLKDIQRHMGMDHRVDLVPLDGLSAEYRHTYQAMAEVAGTFQEIDGHAVIRYDPEQMQRPLQFINVMAHELMHARLNGREDDVPGGVALHELATDLGCIIAGFGVFQMQAADDAGWSGYMTQASRAYALAVFLDRRGLGMEEVAAFLSPRCKKMLRKAVGEVKQS